uniref:Putative integral membrane protein n=1 Tax=Rhodococcus hoagii TaxID=43767 RepID=A0A1Z1V0G9_RHOHA|nr:putative integral membrane protein [Prescottella equi]
MSVSCVTVSGSGEEWAAARHDQVPRTVRFPGRIRGDGPSDSSREQAHSSVGPAGTLIADSSTAGSSTDFRRRHLSESGCR